MVTCLTIQCSDKKHNVICYTEVDWWILCQMLNDMMIRL